MMDEAELIRLNERIGEAEQTADGEFLRAVLADELVFRRASGRVVTKEEFLADLSKNNFERETKNVRAMLDEEGKTALVTAVIHARGKDFQNLRVFVRRAEGDWRCIVWFNTEIS